MRLMIGVVAVLAFAGCAVPQESDPESRKVRRGMFYSAIMPAPDQDKAAMQRRLETQGSSAPLRPFDEAWTPSRRSEGAYSQDLELRDWRDVVLANADERLLRQMRDTSAARVKTLESRIEALEKTSYAMRPGRAEELRHELATERRKLGELNGRIGAP